MLSSIAPDLLSLICDLHDLGSISQCHASSILLRTDSTGFSLILDESNSPSSRHQPDFPKALESAKDSRQSIDVVFLRQILDEQDLVRRQVFVRNNGGSTGIRRFETRASGGLRRTSINIWCNTARSSALESLLLLSSFCRFLLVCKNTTVSQLSQCSPI